MLELCKINCKTFNCCYFWLNYMYMYIIMKKDLIAYMIRYWACQDVAQDIAVQIQYLLYVFHYFSTTKFLKSFNFYNWAIVAYKKNMFNIWENKVHTYVNYLCSFLVVVSYYLYCICPHILLLTFLSQYIQYN